LISFGTPRWSRIDAGPLPSLDAADAQDRVVLHAACGRRRRQVTENQAQFIALPPA
jgi:hypothetical protein